VKKFSVTILALFYLVASSGTSIYMHYCMGNYIQWSFTDKASEDCSNCGMPKKTGKEKGCCNADHKKINVENHNLAQHSPFQLTKFVVPSIHTALSGIPVVDKYSYVLQIQVSNSPPNSELFAVYIRNCVFRI
jgi:hypothetical protein